MKIFASRHLPVQSQQQKHQNNVQNLLRRSCVFIINFEQISLCSGLSIVDLNK